MTTISQTARDPSDWLSPILVKELRQGMRGRLFLISFLLLQAAMILCVSGQLLSASSPQATGFSFFSGLFWFIIGVALLGVIPAAGMGALRSEFQAKSIELISLTRLTPWRIVAGKWTALTAQAFLFVCAVLPYIVLRYFLGGIDLIGELQIMVWLLVASVLLTSLSVSASAFNAWVVRGGAVFLLFFYLFGAQVLFFFMFAGGPMGGMGTTVNPYWVAAMFVPLGVLFLFEIGASKIAPPANRHNLRVRLLGLGFLGAVSLLYVFGEAREGVFALALIPIMAACVGAVTEKPVLIRSVYAPFVRRGLAARTAGYLFFYPGWPSGVGYSTLVLGLFSLHWAFGDLDSEFLVFVGLLYCALIVGTAATRIFAPFTARGGAWFLGAQAVMLLVAAIVIAIHSVTRTSYADIVSFLPTTVIVLSIADVVSDFEIARHLAISGVTTAISLVLLLLVAIGRVLPDIRRLEDQIVVNKYTGE